MAAVVLADRDTLQQEFDQFSADRRDEPEVIRNQRRAAFERLLNLGLPTTRQEAWRFTDLSPLTPLAFSRALDAPVDAGRLPTLEGPHHRLVFGNGRYAPGLSRVESLPERVVIGSLRQALHSHTEALAADLDCVPGLEDHPFAARNGAFWEDGAFIYMPRGVVLEQPLQLIFYSVGAETLNLPRVLIQLEEGTQAVIVTEYRGHDRYLTCPVIEIRTGSGSQLDYYTVQEEDFSAWHLGGLRVLQERDSRFRFHLCSTGAALARFDLAVQIDGEGAECELNGLSLVKGTQAADQHVRVEHRRPHGRSQQLFKSVLEDRGRTVFDGLIYVHPHAQKTDAGQANRNLLLSKQAIATSNPRLEILADDVKCNHGSSIGCLDPDALFYLRSRGIGRAEAQALLVYAFANDVIERIALTPLRERLELLIMQRLYPDARRI